MDSMQRCTRRFQQKDRWYVQVIAALGNRAGLTVLMFGPLDSWSRASKVAEAWEAEHGPNTTRVRNTERPDLDGRFEGCRVQA